MLPLAATGVEFGTGRAMAGGSDAGADTAHHATVRSAQRIRTFHHANAMTTRPTAMPIRIA
jgi:hypothetical protein